MLYYLSRPLYPIQKPEEMRMWNYSFMFPSVMVLFTILFFYFSRPRLSIRMNRTYLGMLALEILIILFDILSSWADENYGRFAPWALYALNTAFFMLYFGRAFGFFRYTTDVLRLSGRRFTGLFLIPLALCEFTALSSFATGAIFSIQGGMYVRGPWYDMLFYGYLFYVLAGLGLLYWKRRTVNGQDLMGCLGFNVALLAGTVVRRLLPRLLVMNTFSLMGLLIIYMTYQNPDLYLCERGQAFNMRGFLMTLEEIVHRPDYHILGFVLRNYTNERNIYGGNQIDEAIARINLYLRQTFPACMPFYLRGGRFALLGAEKLDWEAVRSQLAERFQRQWAAESGTLYLQIGFVEIKAQSRLNSTDRVVNNMYIAMELVDGADLAAPHEVKMDAESIRQLDAEVDILRTLEEAIQTDSVEIFLQPVMDSATRRPVAAEALCRIRDRRGRVLPPSLFIPIAEKNGLIDKVGDIVFRKACAFIHEHDLKAMGLKWINVNLSPIQCLRRDLRDRLTGELEAYGIPAEMIHLEITEQSIIDYAMMKEQIEGLRGAGFRFVLDDYGSGYSNLTRVKHYPFIDIKLDMEVVWDYFKTRDSLLPHVVSAFRELGFTVTAEGIETGEMADALTGIGCNHLQGFLFDRPLPIDEFVEKYGHRS